MSVEAALHSMLGPLVGGRAYPDVTPDGPQFPLIIYQQVGGRAGWYLEKAVPSHKHARIQVTVWSQRRTEASSIARQVEATLCACPYSTEPYGAFTALYEDALKLYGARQDFGIWYPD